LEFRGKEIDGLWAIEPWFTVGICLSVFLLPFVVVEKIQKLRFLALVGITAITIFVVTVIYNFFDVTAARGWKLAEDISAWPAATEPLKAIAVVPNILLAFLYQMNFFPIYKGMKNSSDKRMTNASWVGSLACYFIYMSVAFLGYFTYGFTSKDPFDSTQTRTLETNFLRVLRR
jgi:amino acid permease